MAQSLNNYADLYRSQGREAEAEPLYQQALDIQEKALGPEHPEVATTLNNLAGLCTRQCRYADAESLSKRALAVREKTLGPEHPDVAVGRNNLAGIYRRQGRYAEAEPLYQQVEKVALDGLYGAGKLGKKIDFIKIDVQGAEELVMKGAGRLIEENKPAIAMELEPARLRNMGTEALQLLRSFEKWDLHRSGD